MALNRWVGRTATSALLLGAGLLLPQAASAAPPVNAAPHTPLSVDERCGYLGGGRYHHCDGGSRSTVMLDVEDLWGGITHVCVRPGITDLQPYVTYRIAGAWWNGGVGCIPGRH